LQAAEARAILRVLEKHEGSRKKAAEELGVSVVTLWRKLKSYGNTLPTGARAISKRREVDLE
jgi:transcriptional regulator with PAS, ATPase and Fis domain